MSCDVSRGPGPGGAALKGEYLTPDAAFARFEDEWVRLATASDDATFFMFPAAFRGWLEVLSEGSRAAVIAIVDDGGHLRGVLPVMTGNVRRGPAFVPRIDYAPSDRIFSPGGTRPFAVRQLSSVVSWPATSLRPTLLADDGYRRQAIFAAAKVISSIRQIDEVVLPVVSGEDEETWQSALTLSGLRPWVQRLGREVHRIQSPRRFDDIVAEQKKKFRQNVRRARNAAAREGVNLTHYEGRDARACWPVIADIAAQSWKVGGGDGARTAIPYAGAQRRYFEQVLGAKGSGIEPMVAIASIGDEPIAVFLNAVHGQKLTTLLTFRNDRAPEASPGMLLLGYVIDWAAQRGIAAVDLNATQDWVRYLVDDTHELSNVAAFLPTIRGLGYSVTRGLFNRLRSDASSSR